MHKFAHLLLRLRICGPRFFFCDGFPHAVGPFTPALPLLITTSHGVSFSFRIDLVLYGANILLNIR